MCPIVSSLQHRMQFRSIKSLHWHRHQSELQLMGPKTKSTTRRSKSLLRDNSELTSVSTGASIAAHCRAQKLLLNITKSQTRKGGAIVRDEQR